LLPRYAGWPKDLGFLGGEGSEGLWKGKMKMMKNRNGWDAKEVVELVDVKMVGIDAGPL
jgi:hypothetical protein